MNADFLQYGAMGLLAGVLCAIAVFMRSYLTKQQERQDERDKEDRQDRRDLTASFRGLIERDVAAKERFEEAMRQLCAENKESHQEIITGLQQVIEHQREVDRQAENRYQEHERRANERHERSIAVNRELVEVLRGMNGQT